MVSSRDPYCENVQTDGMQRRQVLPASDHEMVMLSHMNGLQSIRIPRWPLLHDSRAGSLAMRWTHAGGSGCGAFCKSTFRNTRQRNFGYEPDANSTMWIRSRTASSELVALEQVLAHPMLTGDFVMSLRGTS
jgi:hypothetical protein